MDPLSILVATITLIETISSTYKTIQQLKGLPKAFQTVEESLPAVKDTLKSAEDELRTRETLDPDVTSSIEFSINTCHEKAEALLKIFKKIELKSEGSKDGNDWPVAEYYYKLVLKWGRLAKSHRVEALMQDLLKGLRMLAVNQVFKTATKVQVDRVEKAIEELAKVEPSVPDSDLEDSGTINVTQSIATGGKGNQAINRGGRQDNTFGDRYEVQSGNMIFGKNPHK